MTIFTKIINKEIPARIVDENESFIVFLAKDQVNIGHSLIVPKVEVDQIVDLEDNLTSDMFVYAKKVAKAIKLATNSDRIIYTIHGFEVPHLHLHLIPAYGDSDNQSIKEFDNDDLDQIQVKIIEQLKKLN